MLLGTCARRLAVRIRCALLLAALLGGPFFLARSQPASAADAKQTDRNHAPVMEAAEFLPNPQDVPFATPVFACVAYSPDGMYVATGSGFVNQPGELVLWDRQTRTPVARRRYRAGVRAVAFSPDSKLLAAGNFDRTAKLFEVAPLKLLRELRITGGNGVNAVAFSPDGKRLLTGGLHAFAVLWNVQTGDELRRFQGHEDRVFSVAYAPDGKTIASAGIDKSIRIWSVSGESLRVLKGHGQAVEQIAFSPDGKWLASAGWDRTVKLWDVATWRVAQTLPTTGRAGSVAFSPDSRRLLVGDSGNNVKMWNVADGSEIRSYQGHSGAVSGLAFAPDGESFASTSFDRSLRFWRSADDKLLAVAPAEPDVKDKPEVVLDAVYSPDGRWLASVHEDREVRLRDAATGRVVRILRGHEDAVASVAFAPDSRTLATGSFDKTIRLWRVEDGALQGELAGHTNWVHSVAFSADGKVLASGGYDKTVRLWNVGERRLLHTLQGHTAAVRAVAVSADGKLVASASSDRTCRLWDLDKGTLRATLKGHEGALRDVAFSPRKGQVATASEDKTVRLWSTEDGSLQHELRGHGDMVWRVAYSPLGGTLASAGFGNQIRFWDPASGRARSTVPRRHEDVVSALDFSPDGGFLVSGGYDQRLKRWSAMPPAPPITPSLPGLNAHRNNVALFVGFTPRGDKMVSVGATGRRIRVWEVATGKLLHLLTGHTARIRAAALSRDGKLLATAAPELPGSNGEQFIRLWDIEAGQELRRMPAHGEIRGLAFSPAGGTLASASADKTLKLWNVADGNERLELDAQPSELMDVAFSPDGKQVATVSGTRAGAKAGDVRLFDAETGRLLAKAADHGRKINVLRFSSDGRTMLTGSADRQLVIRDARTLEPRKQIRCAGPITAVCFLKDERRAAVGFSTGGVSVLELASGAELARFAGRATNARLKTAIVWSLAVSPDGRMLASAGFDRRGQSLQFWPAGADVPSHAKWLAPQSASEARRRLQAAPERGYFVAFAPDGKRLATAGQPQKAVRIWDVASLKLKREQRGHGSAVICGAYSSDGRWLATGGWDRKVIVWRADTGEEEKRLGGHTGIVREVVFSADGKLLAAAGQDGKIKLWNAADGFRELRTIEQEEGALSAAISPDGKVLATGGGNYRPNNPDGPNQGQLRLFEVRTGKLLHTIENNVRNNCVALADTPLGLVLAGRSGQDRVALWSVATGERIKEFTGSLSAHAMAFSRDGRRLAIGLWRGDAVVLAVDSGQLLHEFKCEDPGRKDFIPSLAFNPEERVLATISRSGKVNLWDLGGRD